MVILREGCELSNLQTTDGKLCIMSGASRSGKTAKTVRLVRGFATVFVWDIEAQWCKERGFRRVNLTQLRDAVVAGKKGRFAFVPMPGRDNDLKGLFDKFCALVLHYGQYFGECAAVAEELADVTTVAKAPTHWGMLVRRGLKRGISLFPISQRWAEADKTAIGNATDFFLFRCATGDDAAYMAKKTGLPVSRIAALKKLEYIHFDSIEEKITGHKLTF